MDYALLDKAKEIIGDSTPLDSDCGLLCGAACCDCGSENAGVWLLPGEAPDDCGWGTVTDSKMPVCQSPVKLLMCNGPCVRNLRPFMCRIFPLTPYYSTKREVWDVRMDRRAAPLCPLFRYGTKGLNPVFTEKARSAVRLLASDSEWESELQKLAAEEAVYRMKL